MEETVSPRGSAAAILAAPVPKKKKMVLKKKASGGRFPIPIPAVDVDAADDDDDDEMMNAVRRSDKTLQNWIDVFHFTLDVGGVFPAICFVPTPERWCG